MPNSIPTPPIYQNPHMAENNYSGVHFNAYMTDTCSVAGPGDGALPAARRGRVDFKVTVPGIAATIGFTSGGLIITCQVTMTGGTRLLLMDPSSLDVLAEVKLPPRKPSATLSFAGGYFYLDNLSRAVCATSNQLLQVFDASQGDDGTWAFRIVESRDLAVAIDDATDVINSVLPDSAGNIWFITNLGCVGYVHLPSGAVRSSKLKTVSGSSKDETITKSFASDEHGGVFVVSDYALYRFCAGSDGSVTCTWRTSYNRGSLTKPGQNQQGSGTTPTCFNDFDGNQYVTIADNAEPFMHVNVYDRSTGELVAQQGVFQKYPFSGACENSLITLNQTVLIENNYGNATYLSTAGPMTTVPGVSRVDFSPGGSAEESARNVWTNYDISIPSVVSQLSSKDGLLYTYVKDGEGWFWVALDFDTGAVYARSPYVSLPKPEAEVMPGYFANNYYAGITIGPDGSAYLSVVGGFVAWRPEGWTGTAVK